MNLDHSFVEQVLQQLTFAVIGWLAGRSVRAVRRRILVPPPPVVEIRIEVHLAWDDIDGYRSLTQLKQMDTVLSQESAYRSSRPPAGRSPGLGDPPHRRF
ncbi:hypothetical protein [Paractinoplanes toevensis]|uniref:Uncharacterized protein n=1 Tax=Paractinoplanes toevensis TaxID=571911 RepID=A0A919TGC1_9ACTN|nr:hypothetical protein [Actinoplanes toevensis]GIM95514.1 hypothetical protein Ato02nite_073070 [Actinoplanes toevensis]